MGRYLLRTTDSLPWSIEPSIADVMVLRIHDRLVLGLWFLFHGFGVFGQVECIPPTDKASDGRHEIAFNVASWIDIPLESSNMEAMHVRFIQTGSGGVSIANGVLYSHHSRRHSFIFGIDLFRYSYRDEERPQEGNTYSWYFLGQGRYEAGELRVGYRRVIGTYQFSPFAGLDAAYRRANKEGTFEGYRDVGPPYDYTGDTKMKSDQLLVSVIVGLAYRPKGRWVLRLETGCSLGVGWTTSGPDRKRILENLDVFNPVRTLAVGYEL